MVSKSRVEHPLRKLLIEKGLSQQVMAFNLGISPSRFSMILNGWAEPSERMKTRIDEALHDLTKGSKKAA